MVDGYLYMYYPGNTAPEFVTIKLFFEMHAAFSENRSLINK